MTEVNEFDKNQYLRDTLKESVVLVTFTKKDGTVRTMRCTLKADLLPAQTDVEEQVQKKAPSLESLAVWDLEKAAWRSFRFDSIIAFSISEA
jgi:hypothetical protein